MDLYKATIIAASMNEYGTVLNEVYHGLITKKVDTQIKWANIRKEPNGTVGNFYSKLKKKKGSSKAMVAASAKLLR